MKHTIAQNKQLFNVVAIANAVDLDDLVDGQFGVFAAGSNTSISATTAFAALPDEFRFISKVGGKVYYSFDTIKKSEIRNKRAKARTSEVVNVWEATIEHCKCIKTALLKMNLEEDTLMRQKGLSWVGDDRFLESNPEIKCSCDCTGKKVYDNNVMTRAIANKVNSEKSDFYEAQIKLSVTGLVTYATAVALGSGVPAPTQGALAIQTDIASVVQYNGTAWKAVATSTGILTDVDTFIATNKTANNSETVGDHMEMLTLVLKGKPSVVKPYKDLDVNYTFPRGVRIAPAITLNDGEASIEFTETQQLVYGLGEGADLRAEEFESMSLYTNLNHYPQLCDGIATDGLVYQFENGKKYDTIDFEFYTDKVNKNDGDKRSFGVMLATNTSGVFTALKTMFGL